MGEPGSKQASPTLTPCIYPAEPPSSSAFPELVLETPNLLLTRLVADLCDGFPGLGALGVALVTLLSPYRDQAGRPKCPLDPYFIMPDKCKCVDFQTLKLQELPDAVPHGEMPRHMQLYCDR